MNASDIEQGLADFLRAVVDDAGYSAVPIRTGQDAGELEPFDSVIVVSAEDVEHEVETLYVLELTALVKTPEQTGDLSTHRALVSIIADALGKNRALNAAQLAAAIFDASGAAVTGTWINGGVSTREDFRWVNGPRLRAGLCEEPAEPGDGGIWHAPTFEFAVAATESDSAPVSVPAGTWFYVARAAIVDEAELTVGAIITGLVHSQDGTVALLGDTKTLLIGEDAEFESAEVITDGEFLRVRVTAATDALTVKGSVQFFGKN